MPGRSGLVGGYVVERDLDALGVPEDHIASALRLLAVGEQGNGADERHVELSGGPGPGFIQPVDRVLVAGRSFD